MTAITKLEPDSFPPQSSPSFAASTWGPSTVPSSSSSSLAALPPLLPSASGSGTLSSAQPSYYGEHPSRPPLLQRTSGGLADIDPRTAPRSVHHPSSAALMSTSGWYTGGGGTSSSSLNTAAVPLSRSHGRSTLASGPTSGDSSSYHSYGNHSHSAAGSHSGAHSLLSQSPLTSASAPPQPAHPLPSWLSPVQSSHSAGLAGISPSTGNHHGSSGSSTTHSPYNAGTVPSHSSLYTSASSGHSQSALPLFTSAWNSHQQHHGSAASSNTASHYQSSGVAVPAGSVTSPGEYHHTGSQSAYSAPSYTSPLPGGPTPGSQYSGDAPSSYAGSHYGGASTPGAAASGGASHYTTSAQQQGSGLGFNPLGINVESGYSGGRYRSDTTYESSNPLSRASDYGPSYASRMHSSSTAGGLSRSSSSYLSNSLASPPVRPQMGMRTTSDPSMSTVTFGSYTSLHDYSTDEARWNALLNRSHSADR
jgi:hypothetical protein